MAITFVAGAPGLVATQTSTTTIVLTIPATVQTDDILLLNVTTNDTNGMTATDNDTGGNTWTAKSTTLNGTRSITTLWKRATSGSAGKTVTCAGGTTNSSGGITAYRGCVTTGDPIEVITGEADAAGAGTHASITTLTAEAMVILAAEIADDRRYTANSAACTNPANLVERFDIINAAGAADSAIVHASGIRTGTGATGTFTWGWAAGAAGASHAFALTPAAAGGDVTVNLTGVSSTSALGAFAVAAAIGLGGVAGTGAVGTVTPAASVAITGHAATGSVGTVQAVVGGDVSVALTGVSATSTVGTLMPGTTLPLTGVTASASAGDLTVATTRALSGVVGTGSVGTLTIDGVIVKIPITSLLGAG